MTKPGTWLFFISYIVICSVAVAVASAARLNVMTECNKVVGDGRTDDAAAIQACIDKNPGAEIFLPKTQPYPSASYYLGTTLVPKGNGMMIRGESSGWVPGPHGGGTVLLFKPGVTGIVFPSQNPGLGLPATETTSSGNVILHFGMAAQTTLAQDVVQGLVITNLTNRGGVPPNTVVAAVDSTNQTVTMSQNAAGSGVQQGDYLAFTIPGQSAVTSLPTAVGSNILCFSAAPPLGAIQGSSIRDLTAKGGAIPGTAYVAAAATNDAACPNGIAVTISASATSVVRAGDLITFANACSSCGVEYVTLVGGDANGDLSSPESLVIPSGANLGNSARAISAIQRIQPPQGLATLTVTIFPGNALARKGVDGLTQQVGSTVKISGVTVDSSLNGLCTVASLAPGGGTSTNPLTFTCAQDGQTTTLNASQDGVPLGTVELPTTGPSIADGIKVCHNFTTIQRVIIQGFGRHGINLDNFACYGGSTVIGADFNVAGSDDTIISESGILGNQGEGIYCRGGNCNAGVFRDNFIYYNSLWAIEDQGFLGSTIEANQASYNGAGYAMIELGSQPAAPIATISRLAGGAVTVKTSVSHGLRQGQAVVISGVVDLSFNSAAGYTFRYGSSTAAASEAFFVTNIVDDKQFQYVQPGSSPSSATSTGGNVRIASFAEAYLAAGIDSGSYKISTQESNQSGVLLNNYAEGGQLAKYGRATVVIMGANALNLASADFAPSYIGQVPGSPGFSSTIHGFVNYQDDPLSIFFKGGHSQDERTDWFVEDHNGKYAWSWDFVPTVPPPPCPGCPTCTECPAEYGDFGASSTFSLYRGWPQTGPPRIMMAGPTVGGDAGQTWINSEGGAAAVYLNNRSGSGSGGVQFCSGGSQPKCSASIDASGKLLATQVVLASIPFASLGVPSNGSIAMCSDCTVTRPCAAGGTGAFAKGLNGVWVCN